MSTDYRLMKTIRAADLLDGRLDALGVHEFISRDTTDTSKCLTDGRNYIWMYINDEGLVSGLSRYGGNVPSKILRAIASTFDSDIFSEHEPQYWGFDSEEAWMAAMEEMNREAEDRFYANLVQFVSGEPNDIRPGTIGEIQANIAKQLVDAEPRLRLPEERKTLIEAIEAIYDRDHAIRVTLTESDLALARLSATHEDDMGQG
jgi:hypothetical protein